MSKVNVAQYLECTEVEGPGRRFAVWVQGCLRHCPGCCNPQFLDLVPRMIMDSADLRGLIENARCRHGIEGVTFLGGEPMLQARGLSEVAQFCHEQGLSVMVFTGYTLEELEAEKLPGSDELLRNTDLRVDGAYDRSRPETVRNWAGSTNQRFHFLTRFYENGIEFDERFSHGFELRFNADGSIRTNGFPWEAVAEQGPITNQTT